MRDAVDDLPWRGSGRADQVRGVADSGSYRDSAHPANASYRPAATRIICEDPVRRGLLYVGTENAIYVSFDEDESWQPLQNNLPHAPVSGITVQEHFNDLVISTYGRGFWILNDLTRSSR